MNETTPPEGGAEMGSEVLARTMARDARKRLSHGDQPSFHLPIVECECPELAIGGPSSTPSTASLGIEQSALNLVTPFVTLV
jgi:hypothetical protein